MSNEPDDFQLVTFDKEFVKLLSDLQSKIVQLAGRTEDLQQFQFRVRQVIDDVVYLSIHQPIPRVLKVAEPIEVLFGVPTGLYLIKTTIAAANPTQCSFHVGKEVYRLQRRNNFRTLVPAAYKIEFRLTSYRASLVGQGAEQGLTLRVLDMSAGGMRALWSEKSKSTPQVGDHLTGILHLTGGRKVELFGQVKTTLPQDLGPVQVGIEFANISVRDEQALLFVCMQIQREQTPVISP
jgi:hypothetical protein